MNIPCERMLWQYWEELGCFRAAFVRWGEELLEGYDRALAEGRLPAEPIDRDALDEVEAAPAPLRVALLRNLIQPLHGNGTTLRDLVDRCGFELSLVVAACLGPHAAPLATKYADIEDEIVYEGVQDDTWQAFYDRHGLWRQQQIGQRLAQLHGVQGPQRRQPALRAEAVELLQEMSAPDVLVEMRRRHPDSDEVLRWNRNLLNVWKHRAKEAA